MRVVLVLLRHSIRRRRGLLAVTFIVLFLFQIFMILAGRALELSGKLAQIGNLLPDFLRQWSNMVLPSFAGLVSFGYSHPIPLLFLVVMAIAIGTEPASEIESKFVDVLMARPVPRGAVIRRSSALLVVAVAGAIGSMLAGTFIGLQFLTPPSAAAPSPKLIGSLAVNLAAVVLAWGGIALAIASLCNRHVTAAASSGMLAFAMFVLDYVGRFWDAVENLAKLSPFRYFDPFALIGGAPLAAGDAGILVAVFVAGTLVASIVYSRRDL